MRTFAEQRRRSLGLLAAGVLVAAACESPPNTVTDLTEQQPVLKVVMATTADAVFPSGSTDLSETVISGFDTSVPDAFARGTAALDDYVEIASYAGAAQAFDIGSAVRTAATDTRLPALAESEATVDYAGLFNPAWCCGSEGFWNFIADVSGLTPDTYYTVVLARLQLDVNGELDQNEVLLGRTPANPDELSLVAGASVGDPTTPCDFSTPVAFDETATEVIMGGAATDGAGFLRTDCIPTATGNAPWWRQADTDQPDPAAVADSLPFGPNDVAAAYPMGHFNYVLWYEGEGTDGPLVLRAQVGPDLDAAGNVINNTMKPVPTAVADDPTSLPGGAESFPAPGRVDLTLSGLAATGQQYALWLYDRAGGGYAPAEGSEIVIDGGAPVIGSSFASPGPGSTIEVNLAPGTDFATASHVVVSMESSVGGSPGDSKFLFKEYLTSGLALSPGGMTFGGFNGGTNDYVFLNGGSGTGEFIRTGGRRQFQADLRRLPQPPQGFHYATYIVELIPATPVTQYQRVHEMTLDALGNGQDIVREAEVSPDFASYNTYVLLLEPNGTEALTTYYVQASDNYQFKFVEFFPR